MIHNHKTKSNTTYHILLIDASLSPIESMVMIRYLTYKHKTTNMKEKRIPEISSNSSQSHLWIKRDWHKDAKSWLNHWRIEEEITLQNINTNKNIIMFKFGEKLCCNKELENKTKLRYCKEILNPNLEDQKYNFVIASTKNKINISKIRRNSHELHSKTWHCTIPKT
jgi:hypothetical protein